MSTTLQQRVKMTKYELPGGSELKIPCAVDQAGKIFLPGEAEPGGRYFCPSCGNLVIFRKGEVRTPHFAHKKSATCSLETVLHKSAKMLIREAVMRWRHEGHAAPMIYRTCKKCGMEQGIPLQKVDDAVLEYQLDQYRIDVALLAGGKPVLGVEIFVTHEVDEEKFKKLGVPFIELEALSVLEDSERWHPIRTTLDEFTDEFTCESCREKQERQEKEKQQAKQQAEKEKQQAKKQHDKKVQELALRDKIELPKENYLVGINRCWKCKEEILVFVWSAPSWQAPPTFWQKDPPPEPKPVTIQYRLIRTDKGQDKFWLNVCPFCDTTQSFYYLTEREQYGYSGGIFQDVWPYWRQDRKEYLQAKIALREKKNGLL